MSGKGQTTMAHRANSGWLITQLQIDTERLSYIERVLARRYIEDEHNMTRHERDTLAAERDALIGKVREYDRG